MVWIQNSSFFGHSLTHWVPLNAKGKPKVVLSFNKPLLIFEPWSTCQAVYLDRSPTGYWQLAINTNLIKCTHISKAWTTGAFFSSAFLQSRVLLQLQIQYYCKAYSCSFHNDHPNSSQSFKNKGDDFSDSLLLVRSSQSSENFSVWSLQILPNRPNHPHRTQFYPSDWGHPNRPGIVFI